MTISFTIATRTCNQPYKKHDIARNRIQHGERSCALRAILWTLNMATVQSLMWEIYKMHPYHIKEIKNQPRFKIFNLTLILTCNIHIQRILLGNCVRVRFFLYARFVDVSEVKRVRFLIQKQRQRKYRSQHFLCSIVYHIHTETFIILSAFYVNICFQCASELSNFNFLWTNVAATRGEMWHGRQQHRRSRIISKNYHEDKDVMR